MTEPTPSFPLRYIPLGSTGMKLSHISYGAAAIGSVWHDTDRAEAIASVHAALGAGVNYIDTAPWYGQGLSESVLGDALADVPRESYFIGTKVGRYEKNVLEMFDFSKERVARSVRESLARLKLDYVDIIQVHRPCGSVCYMTLMSRVPCRFTTLNFARGASIKL